jgi:deoxycytidylate deaminase/Zn-dependent protease
MTVEHGPPPPQVWERPTVRPSPGGSFPFTHLLLFVLTFGTTSIAGALAEGANPFADPAAIRAGFPFSITLMSILLAHEMGHYFLSRYHGVPATLPYFLPGIPVFAGTFGAFIRLRALPRSRRALFDIGAAGPWAGVLVSLPAIVWGLAMSEVRPEIAGEGLIRGSSTSFLFEGGFVFGDSLLFSLLTHWTLGVSPSSVSMHPIAFAGWFGLFVTFLNLLPVGQLDGGHVVYALFGRGHRLISRLALVLLVFLGFQTRYEGWFFFAIVVSALGVDHPLPADPYTPLDPVRRLLGWLTLVMFAMTFMRVPVDVVEPQIRFEDPAVEASNRAPGVVSDIGVRYEPGTPSVMRPSWDQYFLTITRQVAERSTCARAKVGAVIVRDKNILATGYNGAPAGMPHCIDVGCLVYRSTTPNGETEENCFRTIHAEINAIAQAAKNGAAIRGAHFYITHSPCIQCFKVLINTGVERVVFEKEYKLHTLEEMRRLTGVELVRVEV